jgi:thiosulfate/3-mercaptopyruvate sulfurtransferase
MNIAPLVDAVWLRENFEQPDLVIVDATWYLPGENKDARAEFTQSHIPGAVFVDISELCDKEHAAPHMLPSPQRFAALVGAIGIGNDARIVVYDQGEYAATRIWWMFRVFGLDTISVLDGGLASWRDAGGAMEAGDPEPVAIPFTSRFRPSLVRTMQEMQSNLDSGAETVVDARPPARFAGEIPEMRPGVESGHIPGSVNLHYARLLDDASGRFRSASEIESIFRDAGVEPNLPLVATCGSGVSACHIALGLYLMGCREIPVYDGSWAEWGAEPKNPRRLGSE